MKTTREHDSDLTLTVVIVDNGDGTGTRTVYDPDGTVNTVEELTDLPIPEPPEPSPEDRIAELEAALDALLGGSDE